MISFGYSAHLSQQPSKLNNKCQIQPFFSHKLLIFIQLLDQKHLKMHRLEAQTNPDICL